MPHLLYLQNKNLESLFSCSFKIVAVEGLNIKNFSAMLFLLAFLVKIYEQLKTESPLTNGKTKS